MRLADNDQLTARLQFKRAGEAMPECRPPLSPSTLRADLQQVRLRDNLSKPRDSRHGSEDLQRLSRSQKLSAGRGSRIPSRRTIPISSEAPQQTA